MGLPTAGELAGAMVWQMVDGKDTLLVDQWGSGKAESMVSRKAAVWVAVLVV